MASWWYEVDEGVERVLILSTVEDSKQEIVNAKKQELENLIKYNVFEEIEDTGQKAISCKWVITEKLKPDGSKNLKVAL